MNYNHEFKVISLFKTSSLENFNDVIKSCKWSMTSYREDYPDIKKESELTTPFQINLSDFENSFIDYEDINEDLIISWIKEQQKYLIAQLRKVHKKNIEERIKYNVEVIHNPFNNEGISYGPKIIENDNI